MQFITPTLFMLLLFPSFLVAGQFKVTEVYDGETIGVGGRGIEIRVRLLGIDAPEISKTVNRPGQPFSRQAKRYLADLVLNESVNITIFGQDNGNQLHGVVYLGTKNVNLEMVKAGLAKAYQGSLPRDFDTLPYQKAEKRAREEGKGIWSLDNKYVTPRESPRIH